jgi:uncharacterized membrane protein
MKAKALLLVGLLLLSLAPAATVSASDDGGSRNPGVLLVKLYTQLSANAANLTTAQSSTFLRPFVTSLDMPSDALARDLKVNGVETEPGANKGFYAQLQVQCPLSGAVAKVTMEVLDDATVIARKDNVSIDRGGAQLIWWLPYLVSRDSYVFLRNHVIHLRITSDRNVHVQTDSNSYLELRCVDHLSIDVETRDSADKRVSNFFPNDLQANRQIVVRGTAKDPFGGTDLQSVNVSIRKPSGDIALDPTSATRTGLDYSYTWNYPVGLPAGRYTINVTASDLQGHPFSTSGTFTMGEYGLRISSEGESSGVVSKSTTPGTPARYTLTVLNIGGKATQVQMSDGGTTVPLWTTSFSRPSFDLPAGQDDDVTFEVKPSSTLGGGATSHYVVSATAGADLSTPKASDTIAVDTYVRDEAAFAISPTKPDPKTVGVGGTVDHTFTLRNTGEYPTSVDLTVTGVPTGWTAALRGARVSGNSIEDLQTMEIVDITLRVGAPSTSTLKKAVMKVKCQSREYPTVYAEVNLTSNLVIGVALRPTPPLSVTQDPGGTFNIYFAAWNPDPQRDHNISLSVLQRNSAWTDRTSFKFTPNTAVRLQPDPRGTSPSSLGLEVTVPRDGGAGTFRFTVKAVVDNNADVYASFDFNVTITVRREVSWTMDPPSTTKEVGVDEPSIVFFTIKNEGNLPEVVNVTVTTGSDWMRIWINDAPGGLLSNLNIMAGSSFQVKLGLQAEKAARNKEETTVKVRLKSADNPALDLESDLKVVVRKTTAEAVGDAFTKLAPITALMIATAFVVWLPFRNRGKGKEEKEEPADKDPTHGTVVRQ